MHSVIKKEPTVPHSRQELRQMSPGTREYVAWHGQRQITRGRRPSATLPGEKNPWLAYLIATGGLTPADIHTRKQRRKQRIIARLSDESERSKNAATIRAERALEREREAQARAAEERRLEQERADEEERLAHEDLMAQREREYAEQQAQLRQREIETIVYAFVEQAKAWYAMPGHEGRLGGRWCKPDNPKFVDWQCCRRHKNLAEERTKLLAEARRIQIEVLPNLGILIDETRVDVLSVAWWRGLAEFGNTPFSTNGLPDSIAEAIDEVRERPQHRTTTLLITGTDATDLIQAVEGPDAFERR